MACFSLLDAWRPIGGGPIAFRELPDHRYFQLPCGQCHGCRLERSRQWAMRCMHEAQLHGENCFLTLTYRDECLPEFSSLRHRDFQLFFKRLRKFVGKPIKFYMCGEYGERFKRPHYHALVFGWRPDDLVLHSRLPSGFDIFTSQNLSKIWTDGFASVGELSFESAAYVARYVMKKVTGDRAEEHYKRVDVETGEIGSIEPEYTHMSRRAGGIGAEWFRRFHSDCYPHDKVYVNGQWVKPPKHYDKLYAALDPVRWESIEYERQKAALRVASDNTRDRLRVREEVSRARMKFKTRSLE